MTHRNLACVLLSSAGLLAQGSSKEARPFPVLETVKAPPAAESPPLQPKSRDRISTAPAPLQRLAPAITDETAAAPAHHLDGVAWDARDNGLFAASPRWKASFDGAGATFVPFLGSAAPRNLPVRFALRSVAIGSETQLALPGIVSRHGDVATIARGAMQEQYHAGDAGIEQRFVFASLPQRGAIVVDVGVEGEFAVTPHDGGFRFAHELGAFTYGAAVAFDQKGRRIALQTEWTGAGLAIHVPAAFVAEAELPLTIDPLVGNVVPVQASAIACRSSDIAYDASLQQYVVCWEQVFSATDSDVYLKRLDAAMAPIGGIGIVDSSSDAWRSPRLAGLNAYDKFLVVAQRTITGQNVAVVSRMLDGAGVMGAQTVLLQGSYHYVSPDVGGDPNTSMPTYFTVAFERVFSTTDHDIGYFQVDANGAVRGAPVLIDASTSMEHSPRISKCDGQAPHQTQAWAMVWRRDASSVGQTRMGMVSWDGQIVTILGNNHTQLGGYAAPSGPVGLDVSSPTDDGWLYGRTFVAVDTAIDPSTANRYLRGTSFQRSGLIYATDQQLSFPSEPDVEPSIDTDGRRFAMTWIEDQVPSPRQCAATCDLADHQILRREGFYVTDGSSVERAGAIVALHSGNAGPADERRYAMTWCDTVAGGSNVLVQGHLGMGPGGFGTRSTGCGPLNWNVQGIGAIGETVTLQLTNGGGVSGWVFGFPVDVPLGFCPGCRQGSTADVVLPGTTLVWTIPLVTSLVGLDVSFQGFDFAVGTCLGSLAISNTADLTIR